MSIFQKSVINKHLANLDSEVVEKTYQKFRENYNSAKIEEIKNLKEEEYQDGFLRDIFVDVFGYILKPSENYNLAREFKNQSDSKKADGAILKDGKAVAVIELKSTKTKDLKSVTEQAFGYKHNQPDCKYVIISNFQKLQFYIDYANEYEEFDLFNLQKDEFELLYLLLNSESIFSDLPLKLKTETKFHEENVSNKLYKDYSIFKRKLFENLIKNNPEHNKLTLFKKSQKLLDRFLFILFAEDSGLLPPNSITRVIETFNKLEELDAYKPIYEIYKQYFGYMNIGRKGKTEADKIPAYNGGLFYPDELLDSLIIDDEILISDLLKLSEYDFNTEVDVNILGHIFEHSLNEIEEISAEIEGTATDKKKSKRKKDGVFYTPKYITQYIVENTVGTLCKEKRKEFGIAEIEFDGTFKTKDGKLSAKGKKLFETLENYKKWLLTLKIVDPACGSGAFLNQALNFLIAEHKSIDDIIAELTNTPLRLFDTEKSILENNLYGVDINEESVEIAKLSLWLRTARKDRKLSNLNSNIKCGNSLIDDPEVAGDKAFNWNEEFSEIMQNGGFDVVIGNPPYITRGMAPLLKKTLNSIYQTAQYQLDLYVAFIEKGVTITRKNGFLSYIVPNSWLKNMMMSECRNFLLKNLNIKSMIPNLSNVFLEASVDTMIFIGIKQNIGKETKIFEYRKEELFFKHIVNQERFCNNNGFIFDIEISGEILPIINKMQKEICTVGKLFDVTRGINPYDKYQGQTQEIIKSRAYHADYKKDETFVPELKGLHTSRYVYTWDKKHFISYGNWLAAPRQIKYFEGSRIIFREILGRTLVSTLITENFKIDRSLYIAKLEEDKKDSFNTKYILGILNSKLMAFYFKYTNNEFDNLFPKIRVAEFKKLPIKDLSLNLQNDLSQNVTRMLSLNKQLQQNRNEFLSRAKDNFEIKKFSKKLNTFYDFDFKIFVAELKKQKVAIPLKDQVEWDEFFNNYKTELNNLQSEINKTDKKIDQMVYELYGLSEEEIGIVEGATK